MKIAASYLSIKNDLKKELQKLAKTDINYIHVDVMDGIFVKNKTMDINEITEILNEIEKPKDVHLMVSDLKKYIDEYSLLKPIYITFHYEATKNPLEVINYIKSKGIKAGISIKPNTKVDEIKHLLEHLDLILVMSVEPGEGGQTFLDSAISKIYDLYDYRQANNYQYVIEVDGGINEETKNFVEKADILVVGSFLTNGDYNEQLKKIKPEIDNNLVNMMLFNDKYQQYILTEFIYNLVKINNNHLSKIEVFQLMFEPKKFIGTTFSEYEVKEVNNLCRAIRLLYKDKIENNFKIDAKKLIELNQIISDGMLIEKVENKFITQSFEDENTLVQNIIDIKNNGNVFSYIVDLLFGFYIYKPFKSCMEKTSYLISNVALIKSDNAPIIFTKEIEEKIIEYIKINNKFELENYIKELSEKENIILKDYL